MGDKNQEFLQVEDAAEELVKALADLKKEAISFKSSKIELSAAREKLTSLIDSFQSIALDTKAIVEQLRTIGGPQILDGIDNLSQILKDQAKESSNKFLRMKKLILFELTILLIAAIGIAYQIIK